MRVGQLLTMFSFVRFPLKDATVIHPCFLFSMSSEVQLRECRRQLLETMALVPPPQHGKTWQVVACIWQRPGNIWQHLATRVTACHYITEVVPEGYCVVFSGSQQSLGLGLQTSPMNYGTHGTHGTHGSWAVEPCWSCDKLRLLPTLARRQESRSLFFALVSGQLFVPIFMAFHGTAMKFQQKHWIHCREVLVTGSHWGITGIDAGCLRLGLSDQCPGRTDRPMSHQCCDTVERKIDLYLCKPCRLARVRENKAYPKRGFEWFWRFQVCQNNVWMIIEWSLNDHWMISMSHMSVSFQEIHRSFFILISVADFLQWHFTQTKTYFMHLFQKWFWFQRFPWLRLQSQVAGFEPRVRCSQRFWVFRLKNIEEYSCPSGILQEKLKNQVRISAPVPCPKSRPAASRTSSEQSEIVWLWADHGSRKQRLIWPEISRNLNFDLHGSESSQSYRESEIHGLSFRTLDLVTWSSGPTEFLERRTVVLSNMFEPLQWGQKVSNDQVYQVALKVNDGSNKHQPMFLNYPMFYTLEAIQAPTLGIPWTICLPGCLAPRCIHWCRIWNFPWAWICSWPPVALVSD